MASINERTRLFQRSTGKVKYAEDYELLVLVGQIRRMYNNNDSKLIIETLDKCYQQNTMFRKDQKKKQLETERELMQLLTSLINTYDIEDAIEAIDMWNVMQKNISFFQSHMCWVNDKKGLYLRNSYDTNYVTWMKEGKKFPILRRWFSRDFKYVPKTAVTEQQINALVDIIKPLSIGREMTEDEINSTIVMDLLIGKVSP